MIDAGFDDALYSEIEYLKTVKSRSITLKNGIQLAAYYYKFKNEFALGFSSETPALFTISNKSYKGFIEHCDKDSVELFIDGYNESIIESVSITVATWHLMESLRKKLENTTPNEMVILLKNAHEKGVEYLSEIMKGQDKALEFAVSNPISVIWGPPGTGKTYTLANIAIDFMLKGKRVLMMSQSNISVDGAVLQILKVCKEKGIEWVSKVFRYGLVKEPTLQKYNDVQCREYTLSQCPKLNALLTKSKEKLSGKYQLTPVELKKYRDDRKHCEENLVGLEHEYLKKAKIVATTATKATVAKEIYSSRWDVVIFDEVSMAMMPQIFVAASYAQQHLVLLGDFRQLAPIVRGNSQLLKTDVFEYIHVTDHGKVKNHPWLVMLNEQRRMHEDIAQISNQHIYDGLIKTHRDAAIRGMDIAAHEPFRDKVFSFIDYGLIKAPCWRTDYGSTFNVMSAIISLRTAIEATVNNTLTVGIITPYAAQAGLLNEMLRDYEKVEGETSIFCATVHQFQGFEKDVIIFDTVENSPKRGAGQLFHDEEGDNAARLINVALTRSKGKFIVVGNHTFLSDNVDTIDPVIWAVIEHAYRNNSVVKKNDIIEYIGTLYPTFGLCEDYPSSRILFRKDLDNTQSRVILGHSNRNRKYKPGYTLSELLSDWQERSKVHKLRFAAYCTETGYKALPKVRAQFIARDVCTDEFVICDRDVMWFNMPSFANGLVGDSLPYYVKGENTITYIFKALNLENLVVGVSGVTRFMKYMNARLKIDDFKVIISSNKNYYCASKSLNKSWYTNELYTFLTEYMADKKIVCKECGSPLRITKYGKVYCTKDYEHDTGHVLRGVING